MRAGGSVAVYGAGVVVDGDRRPHQSGQHRHLAIFEMTSCARSSAREVTFRGSKTPFFNPPSAPSAPPYLVAKGGVPRRDMRAARTPGKVGKAKIGARRRASNCVVANAEGRRSESGS